MSRSRSWRSGAIALVGLALAPGVLAAQAPCGAGAAEAAYRRGKEILAHGEAKIPSPWGILNFLTIWEDLRGAVGKDYLSRARDAFDRAVACDSTHAGAASELAALAVASREGDALRDAAAALRAATAAPGAPAELWLWRSRVAGALGDTAVGGYIARYRAAGGDAAMAHLLAARAAFEAGRDSAGVRQYLAGLDGPSKLAVEAYYEDLSPIAREAERAEWGALDTDSARGEWIRRFWARRAAESGVGVGERVAEHYHRLRVALERYRRTSRREANITDPEAIRLQYHVDGLDDRGVIYLLHGAPDTIIRTVAATLPNESWYYRRPGGGFMLHFVSPNRTSEFMLFPDPLRALGPRLQDTCLSDQCVDRVLAILEDRAPFEPRFGQLAARYRRTVMLSKNEPTPQELEAAVRDLGLAEQTLAADVAQATTRALSRDSFTPDLGAPLPFYYDTYAFRGDGGRTDLVVALAVPGRELEASPGESGVLYGLNMDVVVTDTAAGRSFRADSQRVYRAAQALGAGENLRAVLELELPPGKGYSHHVAVRAAGRKAGTAYGGPLGVDAFSGDTLMMSDLVLAEGAGKGWKRDGVDLGLVPPRQFPQGAVITLFYEVYNAKPESEFRTTLRVVPMAGSGLGGALKKLFGKDPAPISLSFTEQAHPSAAGVMQVVRRVDLRTLEPGTYRIEVTTTGGGAEVRRSREFAVIK
ncbi:MAG: GWxTD domain-containing protein [Gemmatimonadetes bacterium]|nr:GWxTD domain-containing protein [Gemmatimonadota bacterium]